MLNATTQQKEKIVFLGPEETYSHKAAKSLFGDKVIYNPVASFDSVINAVIEKKADKGVIPFFNPYEEHIRECQDKLFKTELIATGVTKIDIDLTLATNRLKLDEIKKVYSNSHVFKQCDIWLRKNLPGVITELVTSTAKAAEEVKIIPGSAAICSLESAMKNELDTIAERIQNPKNFTLFFVIERSDSIAQRKEWGYYSFLCFKLNSSKEKMNILDILDAHHLRSSQKWDFPHPSDDYLLFFLEFFGSWLDLNVVAFIADCKKYFKDFRLIGTFDHSITKVLETI
ncbi:MAG: prephenate dehydratase domain-containing protein [Candidatus Omnitrophota bacterium]